MKADLTTLSIDELRERYNELAVLMGDDSDNWLTRSYNRRIDQQRKIIEELWSRSAIDALLVNLQHDDGWVRYFSAVSCWETAPEQAEAVLEELALIPLGEGRVGLEARTTLDIIRNGHFVRRQSSATLGPGAKR
jgi:hypothetical protein